MSGDAGVPAGEYAIVEILGHRTIIGRVEEVERFGAKLMKIEPLYAGVIGGGSIYQFTPCSAETALARQPKESWQLPTSIRAALPPAMLAPPDPSSPDEQPDLAPAFFDPDDDPDGDAP